MVEWFVNRIRQWVAADDAVIVANAIHEKLKQYEIWLRLGAYIDHRLDLPPEKRANDWGAFWDCLKTEDCPSVVAHGVAVAAFVDCLSNRIQA